MQNRTTNWSDVEVLFVWTAVYEWVRLNLYQEKSSKKKYISDTADTRFLYFIGLCHGSVG